jgi:hypothetical protein
MPDETTPWVVKGVSVNTRRQVKVYAAEHDMTMAQAVEAIVRGGVTHDKELYDQLFSLCRTVLAKDWNTAYDIAGDIQRRYATEPQDGSFTREGYERYLARIRALNEEDPTE